MFNLEWSIVSSVSLEDGVVLEGFSFIGAQTGVQVLRPCSKKILKTTFKGFKRFHKVSPVHHAPKGHKNHISTVEMIHASISAVKSRSETTSMPKVWRGKHIFLSKQLYTILYSNS